MSIRRLIFSLFHSLFFLLVASLTANGQVQLVLPADTIESAQPVEFRLIVPADQLVKTVDFSNWLRIYDQDVDFEWTDFGLWAPNEKDTVNRISQQELAWQTVTMNGKPMLANTFTLTFWSDGQVVLPAVAIELANGRRYQNRPQSLFVRSPLTENPELADPEKLAPIKPLVGKERPQESWLWILIAGGLCVLIGLLWFMLRKRKTKRLPNEVPSETPQRKLTQTLEKWEAQLVQGSASSKDFYSELSAVFGDYLAETASISARTLSKDKTLAALANDWNVPSDLLDNLSDFYAHAEAAKYAQQSFSNQQLRVDLSAVKAVSEQIQTDLAKAAQSQEVPSAS